MEIRTTIPTYLASGLLYLIDVITFQILLKYRIKPIYSKSTDVE